MLVIRKVLWVLVSLKDSKINLDLFLTNKTPKMKVGCWITP